MSELAGSNMGPAHLCQASQISDKINVRLLWMLADDMDMAEQAFQPHAIPYRLQFVAYSRVALFCAENPTTSVLCAMTAFTYRTYAIGGMKNRASAVVPVSAPRQQAQDEDECCF